MKSLIAALVLMSAPALADSTITKQRTVTRLADGVWAVRHPDAPDTFPQGNTLVVVGANGALVVDSCYLPSSAREDIAQVRQWTQKPVRWLVNTHWHYDHTTGNAAYVEAFPGVQVVAHAETRRQIAGYTPGWLAHYDERANTFRQRLEIGKNQDGKPLTDAERTDLQTAIAGVAKVSPELKALQPKLAAITPSLAFEEELDVDLGGREVRLLHLGRGNTLGDVVVYLPKERIVATGDLLDHPVPYLGGGYPVELAETLDRLSRLDADTFVPGHGDVVRGKAYLLQVLGLVRLVTSRVDQKIHELNGNGGRKLDEVTKAVLASLDVPALRKSFAGESEEDGDFFETFSLAGLIRSSYAEMWPR
jgi:cyclase